MGNGKEGGRKGGGRENLLRVELKKSQVEMGRTKWGQRGVFQERRNCPGPSLSDVDLFQSRAYIL